MRIDTQTLIYIFMALGTALALTFISTPIVKSFAQKVGAVDVPSDSRRMHDHPIPRMGGLAIFLGFILSVVLFADINRPVQGILPGAVAVVIVGVIDDIVPLKAWVKFLCQIFAALIAVYHGVIIEIFSNFNIFSASDYLLLGKLSIPITVIWIVAITNSVNLIDGLDGLAVGVSAIGSLSMLVVALIVAESNVAILLAALVGACLGFMPYNLNPAKIFMGDTGALMLGYILATVSVIGMFKFYAIISFAVPILSLGLPIFDTAFAFFRRLLSGQNPMSPDRGHFHHRLIDMGLSQKQAVAVLYLISAILGLAAVVITTSGEIKAIILLLAFCVAAAVGILIMRGRNGIGPKEKGDKEGGTEDAGEDDTENGEDHDEH